MQLIAITDIFGKTKHFQEMIDHLSSAYDEVEMIDPYNGVDNRFVSEEEAYEHFQETMGLKKYSEILLQALQSKETNKQIVVLGFSVGASAIWAISGNLKTTCKVRAICFYSSQIRNYLDVIPQITIDLYFAKSESAYDVGKIIKDIVTKPNVTCYNTSYLHGFMNGLSINYDQAGYNQYIKAIRNISTDL